MENPLDLNIDDADKGSFKKGMKVLRKAINIVMIAVAGLVGFWAVSFLLAFFSSLPVDSTMTFMDLMVSLFVNKILEFGFVAFMVGLVFNLITKMLYKFVLKDKTAKFPVYLAITLAAVIILVPSVGSVKYWYSDLAEIKSVILRTARLSELPKSATDVKLGKRGNLFSQSSYLRFSAAPSDINAFIESSVGLKDIKPRISEGKKQSLGVISLDKSFSWFNLGNVTEYRLFEETNSSDLITVVVDDINHVVYIRISHG